MENDALVYKTAETQAFILLDKSMLSALVRSLGCA